MAYNCIPTSNFHDLNLDYVLEELKKIEELTGEILTERLEKLIDERFNEFMINAIYDAESETIILSKGVKNNG